MDQTIKEGYRIFLVEDDTSIVEVLSRQLTRWNFSVYPIQDFQDVLGEFCACSPHLVLMDISGATKSEKSVRHLSYFYHQQAMI